MINSISKKLIENIAYADNAQFGEEVEKTIFNLISLAVEDLGKTVPYVSVSNCVIQPINETFTSTYLPGSDFVYFLGIQSPQLEINSLTYSNTWNNLKKRFKEAWINSSRRLRKRRERQRRAGVLDESAVETNLEKYTFDNLLHDFQISLTRFLTQTSIVYKSNNHIKIVGKDDFGVNTNIIIYPVILEDSTYKLFISKKKGFKTYNFEYREQCLKEKFERLGDNYISMLKIINYVMKEIIGQPANQIFVESLLYNLPETFFKHADIYECFVMIINYLRFTDISEYKSVLNKDKKIFDDLTDTNCSYNFSKFLRGFDRISLEKHNT